MKTTSSNSSLFAKKGLSIDDVGVAWGGVFPEIQPRAGFKTGDFVKETLRALPYNDSPLATTV